MRFTFSVRMTVKTSQGDCPESERRLDELINSTTFLRKKNTGQTKRSIQVFRIS